MADQVSKKCSYIDNYVLTAHRHYAQHAPIVCSARASWSPWSSPAKGQEFTAADRRRLVQHRQEQPDAWQQRTTQLAMQVQSVSDMVQAVQCSTANTRQKITSLPDPHANMPPLGLHKDPKWKTGIKNMWEHYTAYRGIQSASLGNVLLAWRRITAFRHQNRHFRTEAKQRKKNLVQDFLQEARQCCLKQDPAQWYQRVRRLCPAGRREGIHLQGSDDKLLSPKESLQALHGFFKNLFTDEQYKPDPLPPLVHVPLTKEEIRHAIAKLPTRQAAVPTVAPTVVCKDIADVLAEYMYNTLQAGWCANQPCHSPAAWRAATLCLLPKPGKPPKQAGNLRPICIQHPACKILTGLAADRAKIETPDLFLPCYGYVRDRSAEDCLLKVFAHCAAEQQMVTCDL